ncbi:MAG: phage major capsid protein [Deltaproteobacteria bacterium]|nr:phage major capsid protein [Deltaproteobacteria bacterium]
MQELKRLIEAQNGVFSEFKKAQEARYQALEGKLFDLEKESGRPAGPGASMSQEASDHYEKFLRRGDTASLAAAREIKASATVGNDPSGGFFVPEQVDSQIGSIREKNSPMRQICRVLKPKTAEYKKITTTGRPTSGWVGEIDPRPETDGPTLAVLTPAWGGLYAMPAATQDLIEDSAFDVGEWFRSEVAKEFSDQEGEAFITGSGVTRPKGLLTYTMVTTGDATRAFGEIQYVASGAAGGLGSPDKLIDLVQILKPKYRQNGSWIMNSLTLGAIRKLKDGDGNYMWRPGLEAGGPSLLLGYPVYESDFMPDIAADVYPVAFGDFMQAYWIFDRPTTVIRDMYTKKPFTLFYTATRVGSMLQNSEAVKTLKLSLA